MCEQQVLKRGGETEWGEGGTRGTTMSPKDCDVFVHFWHCGSINNRVTIAPFSLQIISSTDR